MRDARTGETIWDFPYSGDMGRCLVADIDPDSPGCECDGIKAMHIPVRELISDMEPVPAVCLTIWQYGSPIH